jgi:hypothetical protein
MIINRIWAMPNSMTFSIPPIRDLVVRHISGCDVVIDPFANGSRLAKITNDLDPQHDTDYHLDALDFLKMFDDESVDVVLYDPPYSPRQVSECYKKLGKTVDMKTTQSSYWSKQKDEIERIVKVGGKVVTCGWNSGGIGSTRGFEIVEILMIPHGGWHNDTIVTVEVKVNACRTIYRSTAA